MWRVYDEQSVNKIILQFASLTFIIEAEPADDTIAFDVTSKQEPNTEHWREASTFEPWNTVIKPLRTIESGEIYALALDGSPKAQAVLNKMIESYEESADGGTAAGEALKRLKANPPEALSGDGALAELVLKNAFFIDPGSRPYASARLLGLSETKNKALIEVYINRRALAEEWYHVVISKCGRAWTFFSITQIAVS